MKKLIKIIFGPIIFPIFNIIKKILIHLGFFAKTPVIGLVDRLHEQSKIESMNYFKNHLEDIMLFNQVEDHWDYSLENIKKEGVILEFGVYSGRSINYFSTKLIDKIFYGFDSFEGLQEDWKGTFLKKGQFNLNGKLPKVNKNVTLIKGWFNESLEEFLKSFDGEISLVHIDCDTYESTKEVLWMLKDYLNKDMIIMFDEYYGYPGWKYGEYKAWSEFTQEFDVKYRYLSVQNGKECSLILL